jgi:small subunit ribosomal protein S27e
VLQNDIDLLNPPAELEKLKHKKKRLVQSPNSFFMVRTPFFLCGEES